VSKACAGVLSLAIAVGAAAQQQTPPPYAAPTLHVTTRIVVLDVVVTDKKGNLVQRQLSKDDFMVYEDGVRQTIRSFEPPSDHAMPAAPDGGAIVHSSADLSKIGAAPVTILVLDELNSRFEDMSFARQMMIKYLEAQPDVLRQPTVLMVATNSSFQQLRDYTQDRDALIQTIKKHVPEYPWRMMNNGNKGAGAVERMAQVLAALQQIAQASSGTPGRKNLIWVGNGFPSADLVSLPPDEGDRIEAAVRRVTSRLLAARVTMYTINPTADSSSTVEANDPDDLNQTGTDAGPDPFGEGAVAFSNFAPSTGGIAYTGRNDLNNLIAEGIAKGQLYYTLSYAPTNKSDDPLKFRHIRVALTDPSLRATTRDGYFPETAGDLNPVVDKTMTPAQVAANLKLDLSAALTTTIAYNGLAVKAAKGPGGLWTLHVGEQGIGWSDPAADGAQHEEATVAAAWYDSKGKLLGHAARELTFVRGAANDGATFHLPVELTGNPVRLRFVVRDALNGRMGTVDVTKF
jgi:VWFA-related protein